MGDNKKTQIGFKFQVSSFKILFLCFLLLFCLANIANAAVLYLSPEAGNYQPGDTFGVEIKIDTEGECINTIEGSVKFSQDILKAVDFSRGRSIISLWIEKPKINQELGLISWSGGIPNGYCGRIPGDPGTSNLLGKIVFKVPGMTVRESVGNLAKVKFLNTSQVLLNDGQGTEAKLITRGAVFNILTEKLEISKDEWKEELEKDNILPESFKIEISRNPAIFDGKYFIVFLTTDKQTGIDHYEILEAEKGEWLQRLTQKEVGEKWKTIVSPYVLENQKLTNDIWVKAIDKAGNERIEILKAFRKPVWKYVLCLILVLILIIIIIGVIWWTIKNVKRKTKNAK